ncbi:MAG: ORC1-type DNA replication protein [Thermoplasmata archaeon]|nr:ORC1-type DNA replication protein [Candidatus Sysuiplasma acidicola]MBX8645159.1 ORC1-type DNA replication protein [Candidatus Sysuiplasma acidicola]MDH2906121.1 ORC1-type DNA replication protein [Methanomassiliicoccales archaeon]
MNEQEAVYESTARPNIFEKYITIGSLFKSDREMLRPSYLPKALPHREKEIDQMAAIISTGLRGDRPSNVLIFGKTGTGKTATVKFIANEASKAPSAVRHMEFVYVNCCEADTNYSVVQFIVNKFIEDPEERAPYNGWSMERVYSLFRERVDALKRLVIVVLDEVDRLVYKAGDDLLYNLSRINDDLKYSKLSIIGIANDLKFTDFLDARVKSRLGEERIVFAPYDAAELGDILTARARLVFHEDSLVPDVIPLCSALAAQEHGDARRALELLRVAAESAEREGRTTVLADDVYRAKNKIELDTVTETVRTLPYQSKLLLLSMVINAEKRKIMTTGDIYVTYHSLCLSIGVQALTQRRIGDLISELDMLGIVRARVRSFGRGGRTKEIELAVPATETRDLLVSDELLSDYKNTHARLQTTLI